MRYGPRPRGLLWPSVVLQLVELLLSMLPVVLVVVVVPVLSVLVQFQFILTLLLPPPLLNKHTNRATYESCTGTDAILTRWSYEGGRRNVSSVLFLVFWT